MKNYEFKVLDEDDNNFRDFLLFSGLFLFPL